MVIVGAIGGDLTGAGLACDGITGHACAAAGALFALGDGGHHLQHFATDFGAEGAAEHLGRSGQDNFVGTVLAHLAEDGRLEAEAHVADGGVGITQLKGCDGDALPKGKARGREFAPLAVVRQDTGLFANEFDAGVRAESHRAEREPKEFVLFQRRTVEGILEGFGEAETDLRGADIGRTFKDLLGGEDAGGVIAEGAAGIVPNAGGANVKEGALGNDVVLQGGGNGEDLHNGAGLVVARDGGILPEIGGEVAVLGGVEARKTGHAEDFTVLHVLHDDGPGGGAVLLHTFGEGFLDDVLDIGIDGEVDICAVDGGHLFFAAVANLTTTGITNGLHVPGRTLQQTIKTLLDAIDTDTFAVGITDNMAEAGAIRMGTDGDFIVEVDTGDAFILGHLDRSVRLQIADHIVVRDFAHLNRTVARPEEGVQHNFFADAEPLGQLVGELFLAFFGKGFELGVIAVDIDFAPGEAGGEDIAIAIENAAAKP